MEDVDSSRVRQEVGQVPECYILRRLPLETIRHICAQFCLHCRSPATFKSLHHDGPGGEIDYYDRIKASRQDLHSLSQTCRALRAQASFFLYHLVLSSHRNGSGSGSGSWFIKSILRNPQMAPEVRFVDLCSCMMIPLGEPSLGRLFQEANQRMGLDISQLSISKYLATLKGRSQVFKAMVLFILVNCRNIEHVNICLPGYESGHMDEFRKKFPFDEAAVAGNTMTVAKLDTTQITPPFTLNSLWRLNVRNDDHEVEEWFFGDIIANVLEAAPRLEVLQCAGYMGTSCLLDEKAANARAQSMIERPWSQSLRELWIGDMVWRSLVESLDPERTTVYRVPDRLLLAQLFIKGGFENLQKLVISASWDDAFHNDYDRTKVDTWEILYTKIMSLADAKKDGVGFRSLREISIPELEKWVKVSNFKYVDLEDSLHARGIKLVENRNGVPSVYPWSAYSLRLRY